MAKYKAIKEKDASYYAAEIKKIINTAPKVIFERPEDKTNPRYVELHPSSFPWCGLRQAWIEANKIPKKPFDMGGTFYTGVGTVIHEIIQQHVGPSLKVLGEWKCEKCKTIHKGKKDKKTGLINPITLPKSCTKCGHHIFQYEELGISYRKFTRGHMDGVFEIEGKYFVGDYKSCSPKKIEQHNKMGGVFPYKSNVAQIKSYCFYVEKEYNIKISGWFLIYVSRDNLLRDPFSVVGDLISDKEKKDLGKRLKLDDKLFGRVLKLREGFNKEYWYDLIEHKPCKSNAQYQKDMHSYDMCPLAKDGTCFNDKRLKNAVKNLNRKIKVVNKL